MRIKRFGRKIGMYLAVAAALGIFALSAAEAAAAKWEETYKDEPYVVLKSERTVELRDDFTTLTTVHMVARIQKEDGKNLGEIPLSYDKSREEVKEIEAFTVTPEGQKLKYQDIHELTPKKDYAVYSDERTKMITMPQVVVGSTIEWKATVESKRPVIPNNFYDLVYFSSTSPVKSQKYTLIVPKDVPVRFACLNGEKKPVITRKGGTVVYVWEADDIGKVEKEEYMPPWDEVAEAVAVTTLPSWAEMSKWAWGLFAKNVRLTAEMKEKVAEITKTAKSTDEKIQAIIEYLQNDLRYVAMDINFHSYEPHPADQVFSNKYGDCKDYTLLGMAMLSGIGVKAYPVLFPSSRPFDAQKLLPMPTYFNHAILLLETEGKHYYVDLLRKGYYFHEVPDALSEMNVFVLNDKGGFFGRTPKRDPAESVSVAEEHAAIDGEGDAVIDMSLHVPMDISISMREQFRSIPGDLREKVFSSFESKASNGGKVLEREWKDLDTPHKKITVRLKYENAHWVQRVGDMMIFGIPQRERGTLFAAPKRTYPIVFQAGSREERRVRYSVPEGYEVINLPKDVVLERPFASYERRYRVKGGTITGEEIVSYKESRTPAAEYQKVRDFFDDVTKLTNDLIMIRKKG